MRYLGTIALLALLGGRGWAQISQAHLQKVLEIRKSLTPVRLLRDNPQLRTQNTYVVDSLYNDLYDDNSWLENRLNTYTYYPGSTKVRTDSLFRRSGGTWVDSAETRYYYTSDGKDSIKVTYTSPDGTTWQAADSVVFTYSTVGTTDLETSTLYRYTTSWQPYERERLWFNAGRLDSLAIDTFNVSTSTWDQTTKGWYKYEGGLLDSVRVHVHVNLDGGALAIYLRKLSYDAASRLNYLEDTFYVSRGLNSQPIWAAELFITYRSPTSQQIDTDSLIFRFYFPFAATATNVTRFSYDANDNVETIVYESCEPDCEPIERDRYTYKVVPTALHLGERPSYSLCGRACESLTLPQSWLGAPYELYNLSGQKVNQGLLQSSLTLPAQPGIYLLITRGQAYRLHVLP
jgi:hypothetical protein